MRYDLWRLRDGRREVDGISKQDELETIAEEVKKRQKCSLWKMLRNAVPSEGDFDSPVVFIGKALGYWEYLKERPFVAAAGEILAKNDISRTGIHITNILKCRPLRNRGPRVWKSRPASLI